MPTKKRFFSVKFVTPCDFDDERAWFAYSELSKLEYEIAHALESFHFDGAPMRCVKALIRDMWKTGSVLAGPYTVSWMDGEVLVTIEEFDGDIFTASTGIEA